MQYWEFKDGKWYNGAVESPTPPPPGTAFWFADENGHYDTTTYVDENSVKDLPGAVVTTMEPGAGHQTKPGSATAPKAAPTPQVTTPPLAGDSSPGTPPVTEPIPPAITPPKPPEAKRVDGRIPADVWNDPETKAPKGTNPEIWGQRNSGWYDSPMAKTPGGPTDELGSLLYSPPAPAGPAPTAPSFQRNDWDGMFTPQADGTSGNNRGETFTPDLLASIMEAVKAGKGMGENGADTLESRRAMAIANALSGPAPAWNPYAASVGREGPANAIDNAGVAFDSEEAIRRNKAERKAYQSGDVDNMTARMREIYEKETPAEDNPAEEAQEDGEGGHTVIGDAASTGGRRAKPKDKDKMDWYTPRRHASGTVDDLGDTEIDRYAGGVNLDDWLVKDIGKPQAGNPNDRSALRDRGRAKMAASSGKGMAIAPPAGGSGGMGVYGGARPAINPQHTVDNGGWNMPKPGQGAWSPGHQGTTYGPGDGSAPTQYAPGMQPVMAPAARPGPVNWYQKPTGGAGSPPATFR